MVGGFNINITSECELIPGARGGFSVFVVRYSLDGRIFIV